MLLHEQWKMQPVLKIPNSVNIQQQIEVLNLTKKRLSHCASIKTVYKKTYS